MTDDSRLADAEARLRDTYPDTVFHGHASLHPVAVVPYDPSWPGAFLRWRDHIADAVGPVARRIEHVGSTAVPGLAAKPIIDIQVSVPSVDDEAAYVRALESLGVSLRAAEPGHRYFRPGPDRPRVVQIHVCETGSRWEWDHLLFRDYLRHHPERAEAYARLKEALADAFRNDRIGYTEAKQEFVAETLRTAEAWAADTGWSVEGQ